MKTYKNQLIQIKLDPLFLLKSYFLIAFLLFYFPIYIEVSFSNVELVVFFLSFYFLGNALENKELFLYLFFALFRSQKQFKVGIILNAFYKFDSNIANSFIIKSNFFFYLIPNRGHKFPQQIIIIICLNNKTR